MARELLDKLSKKIPEQLHPELRKVKDLFFLATLLKMDNEHLRIVLPSLPDPIKMIIGFMLDNKTTKGKRGSKALIPYTSEDISKATKLLKMKPGVTVKDSEGVQYTLDTVQVLIKATGINGKSCTIALSRME